MTAPDLAQVRALTLRAPWAAATVAGKDVENRSWLPAAGTRFVFIHAGKGVDRDGVAELARHPHVDLPTVVASTIVAVAELRAVCDNATRGEPCRCGQWARPALRHWRWGRKWVLPTPVVEAGRLGLWRPSETTVDLVRQALAALLIVPLVCTGRQFDLRTARPVDGPAGQPCGKTLPAVPNETRARYEERARVSGWRLGPVRDDNTRDVICATCAKPDPTTAALCRALMNGSP